MPNIARRGFLTLIGAMGAMPVALSFAQQANRIRTIGFLMGLADDGEAQVRIRAFEQGLERHGWRVGEDLRIEYRFAAGDPARVRALAQELVSQQPAVLVGHSSPVVAQLLQATRTIPIVFVVVADPVGSGFVRSIPRPGGNATGFTNLSATITGKLLTILKQVLPAVSRVALLFSPDASIAAGSLFMRPLEQAGPSFGVNVVPAEVRRPEQIEAHLSELARHPHSGLIVMPDNFTTTHRERIVSLVARWRIPTIYPYRFFAEAGGLISYGVDVTDLFRRAPEYVSRILHGENPANLPVQAPTKFELVINLKTAKSLGLTLPRILLAGADELME